ncbi:MAG: superoxide dismutase [Bacteroidota bacterium]|nr:superoxide dismutase [Bacteroidota bacterium]
MKFELPKLPYELDALEPYISHRTLEFHYGKHHQAYVNNLNNLIEGTKFENATLEQIVKEAEGPMFNNAAQVWNHTFYFEGFMPGGVGIPTGRLLDKINAAFGTFDEFKTKFSIAAVSVFGSGWAWLVLNADGKLEIKQTANAACPITEGLKPLLTCDVWEHAYYLDVQNRRSDYVSAYWNIVNWHKIENRLS